MKAIHPFTLLALAALLLGLTSHSARAQTGNTTYGVGALASLTTGSFNSAFGEEALFSNTDGELNTATGFHALFANVTGGGNTACGAHALDSNIDGSFNTATGAGALSYNEDGKGNTASGAFALHSNTSGTHNTATGAETLALNATGKFNTAVGADALFSNEKGGRNIAIGYQAGFNTTGSANIMIGHPGQISEAATIRIGNPTVHFHTYLAGVFGATTTRGAIVRVDSNGRLGTVPSSRRFKKDIADMDAASGVILSLRPVTFRYKQEPDSTGIPDFGLIAEEVAEISPDLVLRDAQGEIFTVRYEAVNAMLLNEFLKQHKRVQEQERDLATEKQVNALQEKTIGAQQKQIELLIESVAEMRRRMDRATPPVAQNEAK